MFVQFVSKLTYKTLRRMIVRRHGSNTFRVISAPDLTGLSTFLLQYKKRTIAGAYYSKHRDKYGCWFNLFYKMSGESQFIKFSSDINFKPYKAENIPF